MTSPRVAMVTGKVTAGFILLSGFRAYNGNRHGNDRTAGEWLNIWLPRPRMELGLWEMSQPVTMDEHARNKRKPKRNTRDVKLRIFGLMTEGVDSGVNF